MKEFVSSSFDVRRTMKGIKSYTTLHDTKKCYWYHRRIILKNYHRKELLLKYKFWILLWINPLRPFKCNAGYDLLVEREKHQVFLYSSLKVKYFHLLNGARLLRNAVLKRRTLKTSWRISEHASRGT